MAKSQQLRALLVLLFVVMCSSWSEARVLKLNADGGRGGGGYPHNAFNIAFPGVAGDESKADPCDMTVTVTVMGVNYLNSNGPKLAGKYGPMILNALPKGSVPPSAPSKGTNNVKN